MELVFGESHDVLVEIKGEVYEPRLDGGYEPRNVGDTVLGGRETAIDLTDTDSDAEAA